MYLATCTEQTCATLARSDAALLLPHFLSYFMLCSMALQACRGPQRKAMPAHLAVQIAS